MPIPFRHSVVGTAVAALVATPKIGIAATPNVTLYGRINNAINIIDRDDGPTTTEIRSVISTIGLTAEADLGNRLIAHAQYELRTFTDKEGELDATGSGNGGIDDTRIGIVGLKGDFGNIQVGNQWSAYYNSVGTYIDPTYTLGFYLYSSVVNAPYFASNTIQYTNHFGPVRLDLDLRVQDPPEQNTEKIGFTDGFGIGLTYKAWTTLNLAMAYDHQEGEPGNPDEIRRGLAGSFNFGPHIVSLGWQDYELKGEESVEHLQAWLGTTWRSNTDFLLGYGIADTDSGARPDQWIFIATHSLGKGMRIYYEGTAYEDDDFGLGSVRDHLFGFRFEF